MNRMHNKRLGFTFIEVLIYLCLFAVIATASASWIAHLWTMFVNQSGKRTTLLNLYSAHDVIMRDARSAPQDPSKWKKRDTNFILWNCGEKDIGFMVEKDSLMRVEGTFDGERWQRVTKSVLIKPIEQVSFRVQENGTIISVQFSIVSKDLSVENTVFLNQRKLPWIASK